MTLDQYMGPFPPPPDHSKTAKRARYKRGPKSTETGPVVGIHEESEVPPMPKIEDYGWRPDAPGAKSGRGSFETKAQEDAYNEALEAFYFWNRGKDAPAGKPITVNRPNIPNRYDREALADFYEGKSLKRAQSHYDYLILRAGGVTEKEAFSATLFMYAPTI